MPSLSVVFPMHNEEAYVSRAVAAAREALASLGSPDHEIVLVDDASTDRTGEIAAQLAGEDPRIRLVSNPRRLTLGGALRAGFAEAGKDLVFYTDADLPVDLGELPRAVRILEQQQADLLAGYRFSRRGEGLRRALYGFGYNALIRLLFGLRVRDETMAKVKRVWNPDGLLNPGKIFPTSKSCVEVSAAGKSGDIGYKPHRIELEGKAQRF